MKFVELNSHGGKYYVVIESLAHLRKDENRQTKVG
jgi:hypothetical protein